MNDNDKFKATNYNKYLPLYCIVKFYPSACDVLSTFSYYCNFIPIFVANLYFLLILVDPTIYTYIRLRIPCILTSICCVSRCNGIR
jgi:hypothetical protein